MFRFSYICGLLVPISSLFKFSESRLEGLLEFSTEGLSIYHSHIPLPEEFASPSGSTPTCAYHCRRHSLILCCLLRLIRYKSCGAGRSELHAVIISCPITLQALQAPSRLSMPKYCSISVLTKIFCTVHCKNSWKKLASRS